MLIFYNIQTDRFILHTKKTAFIVEHDFIMATYLADRVIVFEGNPSVDATANRFVNFSLLSHKNMLRWRC